MENRARLVLVVTEAVADVWGGRRVGVRISPINPFNDISDSRPQATFGYVAKQLSRFELAYLHVIEIALAGEAPDFDTARLREAFVGTYIANGGYDRERAKAAVREGGADLVAFGRPFIANPDLVERLAANAPLNSPDETTFYGGDERGYTDYPTLEPAAAGAA